jgi:hypothetical protein
LSNLFDDDLIFVHLNGYITSKQEWMGQLRSRRFVYDRIDLKEASRVRGHGRPCGEGHVVVNGGRPQRVLPLPAATTLVAYLPPLPRPGQ